ncbi:SufS family cysteine desulfurase [Candidatus Peregrinibacteria bacterium]|nr:SufS family cysteine desulfurase [Candidatus Peregrinibacteria bacterium]
MTLHLQRIRSEFPILEERIDSHPLIYFDSAATAQKPQMVLDAMRSYFEHDNANAHRGMHVLAERATVAFEDARKAVQKFLHAKRAEEIIFTKNCTEAINLVARCFGSTLTEGDTVVLSLLEHHSNIIPWLQLMEERGVELRWIDIDEEGRLRLDQLDQYLAEGTVKLIAITAQSNVLGVRPPLKEIIKRAHAAGAKVCIDAAQSIAHEKTDVQEFDCDFLAFSGHKLYGPTGIGVLYGKKELLETMPPFLGGGMMIRDVHTDHFLAADLPQKFEAGSQPIAEAVGLRAAIKWLAQFSWQDIAAHDRLLLETAFASLKKVPGLTILGPQKIADDIAGCISFAIEGIHPHDLTDILGKKGICLRAGHHCTQPLHRKLGIVASTRMSFGIYNTLDEIASCIKELKGAMATFTK